MSAELAGRPLRADAERNRRLIVAAAARVLARDGLDASFDDIAREAGVGVGTVYRRFPSRERLLQALFEDRLESMVELADRASAAADATAALRAFLEGMVELHVADRGLKELVFSQAECAERMVGTRERMLPVLESLVTRAQQQGGLRADVGMPDVTMAVFMVASAGALTADTDASQWRRQFALVWAGLATAPDHGERVSHAMLPGTPMSIDQLNAAFNQGPALRRETG